MEDFFEEGLRFACTQCSRCCRHDPGYVFLSPDDCRDLADFLKLTSGELISRYCRKVGVADISLVSLLEKENKDCIFWNKELGCSVYEARPVQCRTYPFWATALESQESWDRESNHCPGIGLGRIFTYEEIKSLLSMRKQNLPMIYSCRPSVL